MGIDESRRPERRKGGVGMRTPVIPQQHNAERAVIAAILKKDGMLMDLAIAAGLNVNSFNDPAFARIFAGMLQVAKEGGRCDLVTLGTRLPDDAVLLAELHEAIASTVNFDDWTRQLRQAEAARMVRRAALRFSESAGELPPAQTAGEIAKLAEVIGEAGRIMGGNQTRSLREIGKAFADNIHCEAETIPYFPALTEGADALRHHRREMHVICANTGCGKTCLAAGAVREQLKAGLNVAYFCTESESEAIFARIVAQFSGVSHFITQQKNPDRVRVERFANSMQQVLENHAKQLFIRGCETRQNTPEAIRAEVKRIIHAVGHLDVIVIDFLQFMQPPPFLRSKSKLEQVDYCVESLHGIFNEFNSAGIVLAQINREGQRFDGMPGLEHIKDSSFIAQLAHTVSFLHRDQKSPTSTGKTRFYSRKTRNQNPFALELTWNGAGYDSEPLYNSEGL